MKRLILDTNIISNFLLGDKLVISRLLHYNRQFGNVDISIISYYEVLKGLYYKPSRRLTEDLNDLLSYAVIHSLDLRSAEESARIAADLKSIGRPNGPESGNADVLIAGIARALEYGVCTANEKHFINIPGLHLENWTK